MSIEFIILNIALLILSYVVIRYKEYKKSLAVFLIMVLTIFYSPTIYYILGGTAYKTFDDGDLKLYMLLGSTTFIFYALMICIKNNTKQIRLPKIKRKKAKSIAMIYIFAVSLIVFLYIALFLNRFPLIQALFYGISILRPDTIRYIPYYFTFSVFMHFIIPSFYFYIVQNYELKKVTKILLLILTSVIIAIGGNKGILVFFFIFIWVFEYKMKVNIPICMMAVSSIFLYIVLGSGFSGMQSMFSIFFDLASPLRRFFVTQGAMLINRLHMVRINYNFDFDLDISENVYRFVYGDEFGSAPTYFMGDFIVQYGVLGGFIIHIFIMAFFILLSKRIDASQSIFTMWSYYSILYLIAMGGIGNTFMWRVIAIVTSYFIIRFLDPDIKIVNSKLLKNNHNGFCTG